jgi:isopentenyl-diphosphate delta-isomerase
MEESEVLLTTGDRYDKIKAHKEGKEHYALSVLIFNSAGDLLLQKRADDKYHSGGLWTNTCCTHPLTADIMSVKKIAQNRLQYEMGIECKELKHLLSFHYIAECNCMIENECDFVFVGYSDRNPVINPAEASDFKWDNLNHIDDDRMKYPYKYTKWFHVLMERYKALCCGKRFTLYSAFPEAPPERCD